MPGLEKFDRLQSVESQLKDLGIESRQIVRLGFDPKADQTMSSGRRNRSPPPTRKRPLRHSNFNFDSPEAINALQERWQQQSLSQKSAIGGSSVSSSPTPSPSEKDASTPAKAVKSVHFPASEEKADKAAEKPKKPTEFTFSLPSSIQAKENQQPKSILKDRSAISQTQPATRGQNHTGNRRGGDGIGATRPGFLGRINDQLQGTTRSFGSNSQPTLASAITRNIQVNDHIPNNSDVVNNSSDSKANQNTATTPARILQANGDERDSSGVVYEMSTLNMNQGTATAADSINKQSKALENEHEVLGRLTQRKFEELKLLIEMFEEVDAKLKNRPAKHFQWDDRALERLKQNHCQLLTPLFGSPVIMHHHSEIRNDKIVEAVPQPLHADLLDLDPSESMICKTITAAVDVGSGENNVQTPSSLFGGTLVGSPEKEVQASNGMSHGKTVTESFEVRSPKSPNAFNPVLTNQNASGIWQKEQHPSGRAFYYHTGLKRSRWEKPNPWSFVEERVSFQPWRIRTDREGRRCYFNSDTKQNVWTMPEELEKALGDKAKQFMTAA